MSIHRNLQIPVRLETFASQPQPRGVRVHDFGNARKAIQALGQPIGQVDQQVNGGQLARIESHMYRCGRIELLVDATKGTARMAVAQPPGSKAEETLDFMDATAGRAGPIALQMHNAGLFDEYKDMTIEVDPKDDRLITTL